MLIGDGWLYLSQPGYGGSCHWTPVAWCDKSTGRVYSLIGGLSNEQAIVEFRVALVRRWVRSPEGQARIAASMEAAQREIERLREARRIDPETLRIPMTI